MIDLERLATWMDGEGLPGKGEPIEARILSGGTQNVIYEIRRGEERVVLRMPPPEAPADRDQGIMREWQIIKALDGTEVPHAKAIGASEDATILGRPFYLMGFVEGWSPMETHGTWPEPFNSDLEARAGLGYQLAEGIALLAKVDWKARGLEGLGRPEQFHERQVDRWSGFFEKVKSRELDGMDVASAWLRSHKPLDYIPGIMHGDYQFANVMYKDGAPAQLAALVDWEMGTVGDPKLDLGWMIQAWPADTSSPDESTMGYVDYRGMPSQEQILDHYAKVSGRQVDDADYYIILAKWKLAIVLERGFARAGNDEKLLAFGPVIEETMRGAADLAESTDYGR